MTRSLVWRLVAKDLYLSRATLALVAFVGAASVASLYLRDGFTSAIGMMVSLIAIIFLGSLMPTQTIVNERQRHNLAFVMSLPVSPMQYTTSKVVANLIGFLGLWLPITGGVIGTVAWAGIHNGVIPFMVVAALAPALAFAVLLAVAIVSESDTRAVVTTAACNVSYSFVWLFISRIPGFWQDLQGPEAIWRAPMVSMIAIELAGIAIAIGLTFYLQSKKTDFI